MPIATLEDILLSVRALQVTMEMLLSSVTQKEVRKSPSTKRPTAGRVKFKQLTYDDIASWHGYYQLMRM